MNDAILEYVLPESSALIRVTPSVLAHLRKHRQARMWHCEAGGQLFATISSGITEVAEATGPRPTDRRSMFGYVPDRNAEREEIKARYAQGLHFVGDWHTHRQRIPHPSPTDIESMADMVRRSDHSLSGFVLLVVGTARFPEGLHASFHTASGYRVLSTAERTDDLR